MKQMYVFLLLIAASVQIYANGPHNVTGIIKYLDGSPAEGAAVLVRGSNRGVIAGSDGKFLISAENGEVLVVSMVGFVSQEFVVGRKDFLNIVLEEDSESLEEAVVVGYGVQKKFTITGAVNSVSSEELLRSPTANISNTLAGLMPGLTAIQESGEPGNDGTKFRIRGTATLNGGESAEPLIIVDGIERPSMDDLNPDDIESVNILKDASSTAVYGVRGANGVIIVTTKSGKTGRPRVSINSSYSLQSYTMTPEFCNAYEWATLVNEGIINQGSGSALFPEEAMEAWRTGSNPDVYPDTDWLKMMLKEYAPMQKIGLNVSGASKDVKYYISAGYLHQEGLYRDYDLEGIDFSVNPKFAKYNLRANMTFTLTKRLSVKLNSSIVYTDGHYANVTTSDIFGDIYNANPAFWPGMIDGKIIKGYNKTVDPLNPYGRDSDKNINPFLEMYEAGYNNALKFNTNLSVEVNYDMSYLLHGLTANAKVAYDQYSNYVQKFTSPGIPQYSIVIDETYDGGYYLTSRPVDNLMGKITESFGGRRRTVYMEAGLNYAKSFRKHKITALALYNQRVTRDPSFEYKLPKSLLGVVGRVTYGYANRYLAEVNVGYNGSENFDEGKRFGLFPAFSFGWIISEEPFFKKNRILNFAKIRASYGEVGNDKIGSSRYLYLPSVYYYGTNGAKGYHFGETRVNSQYYKAVKEGNIGNPDVTWERARKANVGADIKMFRRRLSVSADYFAEYRDNILWTYGSVPTLIGATFSAGNIGKVFNHGCEFEVSWKKTRRQFTYWVKGSYSFSRNKILEMDESKMKYPYLMKTGYSVGQLTGYVNEGFINTDEDLANMPTPSWGGNLWGKGELKFVDIDGDGMIDSNDRCPIGYDSYPEITYGLSFGLTWKNFDFSALFQGASNSNVYMTQSAVIPLYSATRNAQKWHMGRWTEERYLAGEEITFPRVMQTGSMSPSTIDDNPLSTFWIFDSDYLRLKNVQMSYTVPLEKATKGIVSSIVVTLSGANLFTWSHMHSYDPESPSGRGNYYPVQKVYNIGLKLVY